MKKIKITGIILVMIVLGSFFFIRLKLRLEVPSSSEPAATRPAAAWRTFKDPSYKFYLRYPQDLILKEGTAEENPKSGLLYGGLELDDGGKSTVSLQLFDSRGKGLHDYILAAEFDHTSDPGYAKPEYRQLNSLGWKNLNVAGLNIWNSGLKEDRSGYRAEAYAQDEEDPDIIARFNFGTVAGTMSKKEAEDRFSIFIKIVSTFKF